MSGGLDLPALMADLEAAFAEVATSALGLSDPVVEARLEEPPQSYQGAYLALVSPQGAIQIGLASDEGGCQSLSRGLMGMTEADPPLSAPEMADAFCEIVNIVAGGFKSRAREKAGSFTMGLPVFFHGPAQPTGHTAVEVSVLRTGALRAALLLVHPRTGAGA